MTSALTQAPWLQTLIRSLDSTQHSPLGEALPKFPSEEMQRNTTGLSSEAALAQAYAFYSDVVRAAVGHGYELSASTKALDFGFGWGRITRVFMEKLSIDNIHGIDVDPAFAVMTRELFDSENFEACAPFPPTRFENASFDMVFSYSVFSHLSEKACVDWMREFARIVKPGGIVAWTTRHITFFDFCQWAADQGDQVSGYVRALGGLFPDLDAVRAAYLRGEIVHGASAGVGGGGPRDESFYGETWIPQQYAERRFANDFRLIGSFFDGEKYDQACFVFERL
jgi:SAM-dependent methyltransferase